MAKGFMWKGLTEDQIVKLDLTTFAGMINARHRRTLKRGFTPEQKKLLASLDAGKDNIKTHCRDMIILPKMVGRTLKVYNGKEFIPVSITAEMLGHYVSEFSHSRRVVAHSAAGIGATRSSKSVSAR
ncbi:30S ribosomal protein S19 [Candidatus Woesearchaeota archaeon]|nr:30S ribosomal protein S19 [Candidatus Woesearchaeota archaeon]